MRYYSICVSSYESYPRYFYRAQISCTVVGKSATVTEERDTVYGDSQADAIKIAKRTIRNEAGRVFIQVIQEGS